MADRKGKSRTKLALVWRSMIGRCHNSNDAGYKRYGGRGIEVCEQWRDDFDAFEIWVKANGYEEGLSIDRIDNDGNYCPENCQWITGAENARKTSRTWKLTAFGETKTVREWVEDPRCSVNCQTLRFRIYYGWTNEEAIIYGANEKHRNMGRDASWRQEKKGYLLHVEAFGENKPLVEWLGDERCVVGGDLLRSRLFKLKWPAEKAIATPIDIKRTGRRKQQCHQPV